MGATVKKIPVDYKFVNVGDKTYDYYQGTFYTYASEGPKAGFTVVEPPVGAVVPSVPSSATPKTVTGKTYFVNDGTYYRRVHSGSQVVYQVVADPGG